MKLGLILMLLAVQLLLVVVIIVEVLLDDLIWQLLLPKALGDVNYMDPRVFLS